jgi:hypothetical protein
MLHTISLLSGIVDLEVNLDVAALERFARDDSGLVGQRPLAIVRPVTVPALQDLVQLAPTLGISLQPVSSTGEHHRGDTLCQANTVIVDMSGFDEVVRVDRRNRVALLEAGVTFDKLAAAVQEKGMRAMLPLCPRPGKSALTAYLEREPVIYPRFQWDNADPLLCLETIFGNGELFRTGAAAGPGTLAEQWASGNAQKTPLGPGHTDVARIVQGAQGNLGIVTWGTAKAEPAPARETLYVLTSHSLKALTSLCQTLLRRNLPDICFIVDGAALAALKGEDSFKAEPSWHLLFSLSAPQVMGEEKLAWVQAEVADHCREAGLERQLHEFVPQHVALHERLLKPALNTSWWKKAGKAATRELFFQTTLDHCEHFLPVLRQQLRVHGWPGRPLIYIQPQLGGRHCHMEFVFPHDPAMRLPTAVTGMVCELACELKMQGAFFSRPYGPLVNVARAGRSANALTDRLTEIFDPEGVMAGSRWPICRHVVRSAQAA